MTHGSNCCDERGKRVLLTLWKVSEGLWPKSFISQPYSFTGAAAVWLHTAVTLKAAKIRCLAPPLTRSNLHTLHSVLTLLLLHWYPQCNHGAAKSEAQRKPLGCTQHHQSPGETWRPRCSIQVTEHWLVLVHQQGRTPKIPLFSWQPSWLGFKIAELVDITHHNNANASGTVIPQQLRDNEPLCNDPTSTTWQKVKRSPWALWVLVNESFCFLFFFYPIKVAVFSFTLTLNATPELV